MAGRELTAEKMERCRAAGKTTDPRQRLGSPTPLASGAGTVLCLRRRPAGAPDAHAGADPTDRNRRRHTHLAYRWAEVDDGVDAYRIEASSVAANLPPAFLS